MCGLAFLYSEESSVDDIRRRVAAALLKIVHRGPDDDGLVVQGKASIGHRRLAIIDLEASRQPMTNPEGRFVLAYNEQAQRAKLRWSDWLGRCNIGRPDRLQRPFRGIGYADDRGPIIRMCIYSNDALRKLGTSFYEAAIVNPSFKKS